MFKSVYALGNDSKYESLATVNDSDTGSTIINIHCNKQRKFPPNGPISNQYHIALDNMGIIWYDVIV